MADHAREKEHVLPDPSTAQETRVDHWRPIETAPKDADILLLYLNGSGVQPGYWSESASCWFAVETQGLTGGQWHSEPTHWMPLPTPPADTGDRITAPAPADLATMKYTAEKDGPCAACEEPIRAGELCYRDQVYDAFRHVMHGAIPRSQLQSYPAVSLSRSAAPQVEQDHGLEWFARQFRAVFDGFVGEAMNGVICSIPDEGLDTAPHRMWCKRCQLRWQKFKGLCDMLDAASQETPLTPGAPQEPETWYDLDTAPRDRRIKLKLPEYVTGHFTTVVSVEPIAWAPDEGSESR